MNRIVIVNSPSDISVEMANKIEAKLKDIVDIFRVNTDSLEAIIPLYYHHVTLSDYVIAVGGDGTILAVARAIGGAGVPIFGINTGHLGYLSATEVDTAFDDIDHLLRGEYSVEERALLSVETEDMHYLCLNECVLHRGSKPRLLMAKLYINGQEMDSIRGDGILVATPTGSTAYNLSAGGPVIVPTARCMVMTPICAHSLSARPIVLSEKDEITIELMEGGCSAELSADGVTAEKISRGKKITARLSEEKLLLVRTGDKSFYKTLRKKLSGK